MGVQMYRSFLAVAKSRNFTQTARYLNFTQPTITNHIRTLEKHYGVTLFVREGKSVYLTEAGKAFVPFAEKLVLDYETGLAQMHNFNKQRKQLKIAISTQFINYYLTDIVCQMRQLAPELIIMIDRCMDVETLIQEAFVDKKYDLAFVHKDVQPLDTICKKLWKQKVVWAVSPQLYKQKRRDNNIYHYAFVGYKENSVYYKLCKDKIDFLRLPAVMTFNDSESVIYALKQGLGISLVPEVKIREEIKRRELTIIPAAEQEYIPVSLLMSCELNLTPDMQKFLNLVMRYKA